MTNYIFIDGSYFVFYRFHALLAWWRLSHKDEKIDNPIENKDFVEKFKKLFIENIQKIGKKLSIDEPCIIVGKDCPRSDIWRHKHIKAYKGKRANNNVIKPFFIMAYNELFEKAGVSKILSHKKLEADDCIAIATRHYLKDKSNTITIITSDTDYLQLIEDRVNIYNGKLREIRTAKNSTMNSVKSFYDNFYPMRQLRGTSCDLASISRCSRATVAAWSHKEIKQPLPKSGKKNTCPKAVFAEASEVFAEALAGKSLTRGGEGKPRRFRNSSAAIPRLFRRRSVFRWINQSILTCA